MVGHFFERGLGFERGLEFEKGLEFERGLEFEKGDLKKTNLLRGFYHQGFG